MPKTKFQDLIFSIIMVVIMVYCMTVYNLALEFGFHYSTFKAAFLGMWLEAAAAFAAQKFIAGPIAKKLTFRFFKPGADSPFLITLAMTGFTVCQMAPLMTLFVSLIHNGFVSNLLLIWLPKLVQNFPFALFIQIFYVGPFVRLIFRTLFKRQLSKAIVSTLGNTQEA